MTALVHRYGMDGGGQQWQKPVEGAPRLTPRVQQQDRRSGGGAGRHVRKGYAGCEVKLANALALVHVSTLATHDLAAQTSSSTLLVIGKVAPSRQVRKLISAMRDAFDVVVGLSLLVNHL